MNRLNKLAVLLLSAFLLPGLSGCALAVGAAAGGTAVYILKDKGYEVQSPVAKKKAPPKDSKDSKPEAHED